MSMLGPALPAPLRQAVPGFCKPLQNKRNVIPTSLPAQVPKLLSEEITENSHPSLDKAQGWLPMPRRWLHTTPEGPAEAARSPPGCSGAWGGGSWWPDERGSAGSQCLQVFLKLVWKMCCYKNVFLQIPSACTAASG